MTVELMVARMVDYSAVQWGRMALLKEQQMMVSQKVKSWRVME